MRMWIALLPSRRAQLTLLGVGGIAASLLILCRRPHRSVRVRVPYMCALRSLTPWASTQDQSATVAPVFVFISFEKVASNTLFHAFEERSRLRGLPSLSYNCSSWKRILFDSRLCYSHYVGRSYCAGVQPGAVVLDNRYGWCESVGAGRTCRYFTVLREPLERMVSSYNYFCVGCADNNAHCSRRFNHDSSRGLDQGRKRAIVCPNMTLLEYARVAVDRISGSGWPPTYVDMFGPWALNGRVMQCALARSGRECNAAAAAQQMRGARDRLARTHVIRLEELGDESQRRRLDRFLRGGAAASSGGDEGGSGGDVSWLERLTSHENVRGLRGDSKDEAAASFNRGSLANLSPDAVRSVGSLTSDERRELSTLLAADVELYRYRGGRLALA